MPSVKAVNSCFYAFVLIQVPQQTCLSCSEIDDPRTCQNTTTCAKDEVCIHCFYFTIDRTENVLQFFLVCVFCRAKTFV